MVLGLEVEDDLVSGVSKLDKLMSTVASSERERLVRTIASGVKTVSPFLSPTVMSYTVAETEEANARAATPRETGKNISTRGRWGSRT